MNQTQVAEMLGLDVRQLWSLSANAAFPAPVGNASAGNVLWDSGAITVFAALWTAATANGWKIGAVDLPVFNFVYAAANRPAPPIFAAMTLAQMRRPARQGASA